MAWASSSVGGQGWGTTGPGWQTRSRLRVPENSDPVNLRAETLPDHAGMANALTQNDRAEHRSCPAACYTCSIWTETQA